MNEGTDLATFFRMYKQLESQRLEGTPQPLEGAQQPAAQGQRPIPQRFTPPQHRPRVQPYRQPPRNFDILSLVRALEEVKKKLDDMFTALSTLQNT